MIARRTATWLAVAAVALSSTLLSACGGPALDLTTSLQVIEVTSGWYDAGVVNGQNKLVPSIAFRLKNVGPTIPGTTQLNAVFRRVGEPEEWGNAFVRAIDSNGLASGAMTEPIVLRSEQGYTSDETRATMLTSRFFVDAKVELFAKYGAAQWNRLGDFPIQRVLLTR